MTNGDSGTASTILSGRSFLSYKRERMAEARHLVRAQQLLGIPTFQDIANLDHGPTEDTLRKVLASPEIAGGVLLLTPEVADSPMIHNVEVPLLLARRRREDGFILIGLVAGGLTYNDVTGLFPNGLGTEDLRGWNLEKIDNDPLTFSDAQAMAMLVLQERLDSIASVSSGPFQVSLNTRDRPAFDPAFTLRLDWSPEFDAGDVTPEWWAEALLPALRTVSKALVPLARDRGLVLSGFLSLPAAVALGAAFVETSGVSVDWRQAGQPADLPWSLAAADDAVDVAVTVRAGDVRADDLAVLVSLTDDVEQPFGVARSMLPAFRSLIHVAARVLPLQISSPGEAVAIARLIRDAIRQARRQYLATGTVHFFMAVPAGVAVLLGQLLNTLDSVQTYDYRAGESPPYRVAALLKPSA